MRTRIKRVTQKLRRQPTSQLQTNHTLTHAQHLSIIRHDQPLNRKTVMSRRRTNPRHLVGRNRHTHTSATNKDAPITLTLSNRPSTSNTHMRISSRLTRRNTHINHFINTRISLKISLDGLLVINPSRIRSHNNPEPHDSSEIDGSDEAPPPRPTCQLTPNITRSM